MTGEAERRLSPRFGAETMFLLTVAAVLILIEVGRTPALLTIFAAWLLVAAVELVSGRRPVRAEYVEAEPVPEVERFQPVAGADPFSPHRRERPALYAAGIDRIHAGPEDTGERPARRPLFEDAPAFDAPARGFDEAPLFDDRVRPLDDPARRPVDEPARPSHEPALPPERPRLIVVPPPVDDDLPASDADAGGDAARGAGP